MAINDNVKKLYNTLKSNGYQGLGTVDQFDGRLKNSGNRDMLYKLMKDDGFSDLGEFNDFEAKLGYEMPKDLRQSKGVLRSDINPEPYNLRPEYTGPTQEQPDYVNPLTNSPEYNFESIKQKGKIETVTPNDPYENIFQSISDNKTGLDDAIKDAMKGNVREGVRPIDVSTNLIAARDYLNEAEELINAKKEGAGLFRGITNAFTNRRTWDFGMSYFATNKSVKNAIDKFEKGDELSDDETRLLDALAVNTAAKVYASDMGYGYDIGSGFVQSIPFMIEMAINPLSGSGKAIGKKLASYAAKRFSGKAGSLLGKVGRFAGDVAGSTAMAATTGAPGVAADYYARSTGTPVVSSDFGDISLGQVAMDPFGNVIKNENGENMMIGSVGKESDAKAMYKALAARSIDNFSEMFGAYFGPIGDAIKNSRLGKRLSVSAVGKKLDQLTTEDWVKSFNSLLKDAKYDGFIGETAEEYVGGLINSVMVGDQSLSDLASLDNLIRTAGTVGLMSGIFGSVNLTGVRTAKYKAGKDLENSENRIFDSVGEEEFDDFINKMDSSDPDKRADIIRDIIKSDKYDNIQKAMFMDYYHKRMVYDGFVYGQAKKNQEGKPTEEDQEASVDAVTSQEDMSQGQQSFERISEESRNVGRNMTSRDEMYAASNDMKAKRNDLESMDSGLAQTIDNYIKDGASYNEVTGLMDGLPADLRSKAEAYYQSQMVVTGAQEKVLDDIDQRVNQVENEVTPYIKTTEDGRRVFTTANFDEGLYHGPVYVMKDDGNNAVIYQDGQMRMVDSARLSDKKDNDLDTVLSDLRDQMIASSEREMDLYLNHNPKTHYPEPGLVVFNGKDAFILQGQDENGDWSAFPAVMDKETGQVTAKANGTPSILTEREILELQDNAYASQDMPVNEQVQQEQQPEQTIKTSEIEGENATSPSSGESNVSQETPQSDLDRVIASLPKKKDGSIDYKAMTPMQQYDYTSALEGPETALADLQQDVEAKRVELSGIEDKIAKATGGDRAALRDQARAKRKEYEELTAFYNSVAPAPASVETIQEEQEPSPIVETQEEPVAESVSEETTTTETAQEEPVSRTVNEEIEDLFDGSLDNDEIDQLVDANIKEAEKALGKIKKPAVGADKAAYLEKKKEYEAKREAAQAVVDHWNDVKAQIANNRAGVEQQDIPDLEEIGEPLNAHELAAEMLANGSIKLTRDSYMQETGFGDQETKGMFGLFASPEKGGVSVERAGEILTQADSEGGYNFIDPNEPNAARDVIIDVLSQAKTRGDLINYIKRRREEMASREREAAYNDYAKWTQDNFGMTPEEWEAYNDAVDRDIRSIGITDEELRAIDGEIYDDMLAEQQDYAEIYGQLNQQQDETNQGNEQGRDQEPGEGGGEVLPTEQPVETGRDGVVEGERPVDNNINSENDGAQAGEGESIREDDNGMTENQRSVYDSVVGMLEDAGMQVEVLTDDQMKSLADNNEITLEAKRKSEARKDKDRVNGFIDEAISMVTGKSVKDVRSDRLRREQERRDKAKKIYDSVLDNDFNDVTLRLINEYIDEATPNNPYGRRISQRVPQKMERRLHDGDRTNAIDALFTRISESAVGKAGEKLEGNRGSRERAKEKKKELLKGWAIATGNWHTDISDFTNDKEPIARGKDSDVYYSKDGEYVIKFSKGKKGNRFPSDIDAPNLFGYIFPNTAYDIIGYGEIDGNFVTILRQPIVDIESALTEDDRVEYMRSLGFDPINKDNTAFSNGEVIVADLQKGNVVRTKEGNVRVIDADIKPHTKDLGGKYSYLPVDVDTENRINLFKDNNGVIYGATIGGKIYLNGSALNPETPIHEYTHIWDEACRRNNPELWNRGVDLMRQTSVWNDVKNDPNYSNLETDDEIASEVHSRLTGKDGARILEEMVDSSNKQETSDLREKLKKWLDDFWWWLKDTMMPWTKNEVSRVTLNDFVNMPLKDLANGKRINQENNTDNTRFRESYTTEEEDIIDKSQKDGTYMKAPNGNPTNLSEKQWAQVRTKSFKDWFGDWENDPSGSSKLVDDNGEPLVVQHGTPVEDLFKFDISHLGENSGDQGVYGSGFYFGNYDSEGFSIYGDNVIPAYLSINNPFIIETNQSILDFILSLDNEKMRSLRFKGFKGEGLLGDVIDHIKTVNEEYKEGKYDDLIEYFRNIFGKGAKEEVIFRKIGLKYGFPLSVEGFINDCIGGLNFSNALKKNGNDGIIVQDDGDGIEYVAFYPNQIKSATDNIGTFSSQDEDIRYRYNSNGLQDNTRIEEAGPEANREDSRARTETVEANGNFGAQDNTPVGSTGRETAEANDRVYNGDRVNGQQTGNYDRASDQGTGRENRPANGDIDGQDGQRAVGYDAGRGEQGQRDIDSGRGNNLGNIQPGDNRGATDLGDRGTNDVDQRVDGESDRAGDIDQGRDRFIRAANETARSLGTTVRIINNIDELPDGAIKEALSQGRKITGWYDIASGQVYVYAPNLTSENEAKKTVLHEAVAHKGLRQVIGNDAYNKEMVKLFDKLPEDEKIEVSRMAQERYGGDTAVAMDEYLAEKAELDETPSFWEKVVSSVRRMLRKVGIDMSLNEGDVKYLLWRGRKSLNEKDPFEVAKDLVMRSKNGIGQKGQTRMREARTEVEQSSPTGGSTTRAWDDLVSSDAFLMEESLFDYLLSVDKFQKLITGKDKSKVLDYENAYDSLLQVSSVNRSEMDIFDASLLSSLNEAISKLVGKRKRKWKWESGPERDLVKYVEAKHGIERNRDLAVRDGMASLREMPLERLVSSGIMSKEEYESFSNKVNKEAEEEARKFKEKIMPQIIERESRKEGMTEEGAREIAEKESERRAAKVKETYIKKSEAELKEDKIKSINDRWVRGRSEIRSREMSWEDKQKALDDLAKSLSWKDKYGSFGVKWGKDYSGLSSVFKDDADTENTGWDERAREFVKSYEESHDQESIKGLWDSVKKITDFSLWKQRQSGLVDQQYVNDNMDRFEYFVPLRGFKDEIAADVYQYFSESQSLASNPVKKANQRISEADNPFSGMLSVAYASIASGNKNITKQKFLNFVRNHDTDGLVTVNNIWIRNVGTEENPDWQEVAPEIPDNATSEEVAKAVNDFEAQMEELAEQGLAEKIKGGKSRIPYKTLGRQRNEHQVQVLVGGNRYVLTVNGNPRVAQAINGLMNPDVNMNGFFEYGKRVQVFMAGMFTSKNVAFSMVNLTRDLSYSNVMTFINEDFGYFTTFTKNQAKLVKDLPKIGKMLYDYNRGELDPKDKLSTYFKEFMDNGGATGYTFIESQREYSGKLAKMLDRLSEGNLSNMNPAKWTRLMFDMFEFMGNTTEILNRLAAYETSREKGRSVSRSIMDAKEITVNFSRKGAGIKSVNKDTKLLPRLVAYTSQYGRSYILFWNASLQSKRRLLKSAMNHPIKAGSAFVAAPICMGMAVPLLNNVFLPALYNMMGLGGDDDKEDYFDVLSDYQRQNNICLRLPKGYWLKLPLSPDLAIFYGLGDKLQAHLSGKRDLKVMDGVEAITDVVSPIGINWNYQGTALALNVLPTVFQPLAQTMMNTNFMGNPIKKESFTRSSELDPEYTKVYKSASSSLVELSKLTNDLSGGDAIRSGSVNWNPAILQNLLTGYTGGFGTVALGVADAIVDASKGDTQGISATRYPLLSRFVAGGDPEVKKRRINSNYQTVVVDFVNKIMHDYDGYQKQLEDPTLNELDYAEYYTKMGEIESSEDFMKAMDLQNYIDQITDINKTLKEFGDDELLESEMYELMLEAIDIKRGEQQ